MVYGGEKRLKNSTEINKYFLENFANVYYTDSTCIPELLGDLEFETLTPEENDSLMMIPLEEEIKHCIFALHPLKALGPDGFPGIFFHHYWNICEMSGD